MAPRKITIDASVYLAALSAEGVESNAARDFFRRVMTEGCEVYLPRLFLLELIVSLRSWIKVGSVYSALARQIAHADNIRWLDADRDFTRAACELVDKTELRLADAIYAIAAISSGAALVSLDPQMISSLSTHCSVSTPDEFFESGESV